MNPVQTPDHNFLLPSDGHNQHESGGGGHFGEEKYAPVTALKELVACLQREQNKIQDLLSSLSFALRSFNNLNQFLELTPLMLARVTDADGSILLLYHKHSHNQEVRLEQVYCHNSTWQKEIRRHFQRAVEHINNYIHQSHTSPHQYPPPESFPSFVEEQIQRQLSGLFPVYSVPIIIKNVERGSFYVFSQDGEYCWTQTRRKLAQLVADQTAVAIANHELTEELRSKERQDRELEIASEIQRRLLPRKCPKIKGLEVAARCQTANRVGGDYYDFIPANYDQWDETTSSSKKAPCEPWSIVIGDVMGKGVPAGLIMTMTRGMLRAEVLNRHSPSRVLEHLNRVMYADLENSHRFVTLFYSEYDPRTHILRYANAAHNPPLLWREGKDEIILLDTEGMLIGLEPNSHYQEDCLQLQANDTILYYTDGITDAVNSKNQRFDEDKLIETFRYACGHFTTAEEILQYLFDTVEQFIGVGNKNNDDITLVVVRFNPDISPNCYCS
ncbi:MAG: SpoIIE family protein phosphatase [Geminocystis sp.]|nr:SpoIIE family protein phosphatase [Geminocystis sp.]HIK37453.1 SpoIIE family protein phosphatase [Geminocystis sp. M7585_C2015_104]MCS7147053.1 SpoIIE family protein phosphatase [Geminocystis sp.]MCX8079299.1 SpoIIE family protein phosphatase [Geminocystis sp.]MDW8115876.1 SpoIIE family protein phosphatase [Geminocystis sp.]